MESPNPNPNPNPLSCGPAKQQLKVLMLPWLAYGHISPFLELAKRLSSRNDIQTHLCSTPVNLDSIRAKIPPKYYSTSIHLVDLHLPSLPQLPPHHHTTNGLPLHLNALLSQALDSPSSRLHFSTILQTLQPHLVIHDVMIRWVPDMASHCGIPAVSFLTAGAAMCSYFVHSMMNPDGAVYPFPGFQLAGIEQDMLNHYIQSQRNKTREQNSEPAPPNRPVSSKPLMTLIKTSRTIEGKYIDYLSKLTQWKIMPVGALVCRDFGHDDDNNRADQDLMDWLGKKEENSTVFISFGSEYFLKKEEIEEIAQGLELSQANFIWVIRFPAGEEIPAEEALPEGFMERVGERGRVVEKWAPQGRILGHPSVGGFVSHCGWGSLMESIEFGVPIIAMPMHLDQPLNRNMLVELGVGVGVGRDEKGRFVRGEIGRVIGEVLDGKKGDILRGKVGQVREALRGTSEEEIDGLVQEINILCGCEKKGII